jgi:hypothetical protein
MNISYFLITSNRFKTINQYINNLISLIYIQNKKGDIMRKIIIIALIIGAVAIAACSTEIKPTGDPICSELPDNFLECEQWGGDIAESYPRQCFICDTSFTEEIDDIEVLPTLEELCTEEGGNWIDDAQECEGIPKETCENLGGNFNECASACRNDPDAVVCTMQCVLVCEFDTEENIQVIPEDCISWFDGCNNCMVSDGELGGCTKKYCEPDMIEEPRCLEFE